MKRLRSVVGAVSAIGVSIACSGLTALACGGGGGMSAPQPAPSAPPPSQQNVSPGSSVGPSGMTTGPQQVQPRGPKGVVTVPRQSSSRPDPLRHLSEEEKTKARARADLDTAKFRAAMGIATPEDLAVLAQHEFDRKMRKLQKEQRKAHKKLEGQ